MDLTGKHYTWFQNRECEYFPCHKGVREEEFNCLFCYCPLYRHPNCRGSFGTEDQKEGMQAFLEKRKEKHFKNA